MNRKLPPFRNHPVDLDQLERDVRPVDYAPPAVRRVEQVQATTLEQITGLTRQFDEAVLSAEAALASYKQRAAEVRDKYVRETTQVAADIKRLQEKVEQGMRAMQSLDDTFADRTSFPERDPADEAQQAIAAIQQIARGTE